MISFVVFFGAIGVITLYRPTVMHCQSKLDQDIPHNEWCMEEIPNIYTYVQKVFWNAGFMEFLNRPNWGVELMKAMPTFLLVLHIMYRSMTEHGLLHFLTLGIFKSSNRPVPEGFDLYENDFALGLVWHLALSMVLVIVAGNHEVSALTIDSDKDSIQ